MGRTFDDVCFVTRATVVRSYGLFAVAYELADGESPGGMPTLLHARIFWGTMVEPEVVRKYVNGLGERVREVDASGLDRAVRVPDLGGGPNPAERFATVVTHELEIRAGVAIVYPFAGADESVRTLRLVQMILRHLRAADLGGDAAATGGPRPHHPPMRRTGGGGDGDFL